MDIYVGNINYQLNENDVRKLFEVFGEVERITLIKDKVTERSKGFGFVLMPDATQAQRAIDELDGMTVGGRNMVVKMAKSKYEREDTAQEQESKMEKVQVHADEEPKTKASNPYSKSLTNDGFVKLNFKSSSN